jgi:TRAP-type C4-dicarboxylate transport system permease small subunit
MAEIFVRFERLLMRWTMRAAMALLVLTCFVSLYQVITRFVFEEPSTWSEVVARSLNIWMVYLGVAVAFRTGALMGVDYLIDRSSGRARAVLIAAITGLSLGVLGVMVWFGFVMVSRAQFQMLAGVINPFTDEGVSIATVYAAIPIGAAIAIVGALARALEQIRLALSHAPPVEGRREIFEV